MRIVFSILLFITRTIYYANTSNGFRIVLPNINAKNHFVFSYLQMHFGRYYIVRFMRNRKNSDLLYENVSKRK